MYPTTNTTNKLYVPLLLKIHLILGSKYRISHIVAIIIIMPLILRFEAIFLMKNYRPKNIPSKQIISSTIIP